MATIREVHEVVTMLVEFGLDFTPGDPTKTVQGWAVIFKNVPGEVLKQAALDYAASETRWPAPAKLKEVCKAVYGRGGRSIHEGLFYDEQEQAAPWMMVFTKNGPQPWKPGAVKRVIFPPDVQAKIDAIIEKIGDEQIPDVTAEYIDRLTAPYREAAL